MILTKVFIALLLFSVVMVLLSLTFYEAVCKYFNDSPLHDPRFYKSRVVKCGNKYKLQLYKRSVIFPFFKMWSDYEVAVSMGRYFQVKLYDTREQAQADQNLNLN